MRITKLEITGFKSFLEKTSFDFTTDITGIVGPNGCGKSNIVDALKWITGELSYRELRGRSMEDLIFAGSELRPPTGMAEVALTLDNRDGIAPAQYKDYSEITVLRRMFRDGSSEFFVNKIPCRLRDIIDIFLDTGVGSTSYSIIEQGRVGAIVSAKPEDRRMIIEEAAGITKFKHRKKAAQRKMEATRQNLLRVADILGELKRQIGSLERQAKKASKFRELRERSREIDISISAHAFQTMELHLATLKKQEDQTAQQLEQLKATLHVSEAEIEKHRLTMLEEELQLRKVQDELLIHNQHVSKIENQMEGLRKDAELLQATAHSERERATKLQLEVKRHHESIDLLSENLRGHERSIPKIESELQSASDAHQHELSEIVAMETELESKKQLLLSAVAKEAQARNQCASVNAQLLETERLLAVRDRELKRAREEFQQLELAHRSRKDELGAAHQLRFNFEKEQKEFRELLLTLENNILENETSLAEWNQKIEGKKSRLHALREFEETYQGYRQGVRSIMEGRADSVKGVIGQSVRPQRGYEKAVEAALADRIECILVNGEQDAFDLIDWLKEGRGRAAFLPRIKSFSKTTLVLPAGEGVIGWLSERVEVSPDDRSTIDFLLADVVLVESLAHALKLRNLTSSYVYVTLDGEFLTRQGVLIGGVSSAERGVLQIRREIEELRESLDEETVLRTRVESVLVGYRQEKVRTLSQLKSAEESLARESQNAFDHEKDYERLEEALKRTRQSLQVIEEEHRRLLAELIEYKNQLVQSETLQTEGEQERARLEEQIRAAHAQLNQRKGLIESQQEKTTQVRLSLATTKEKVDALSRELKALEVSTETQARESSDLLHCALEREKNAKDKQQAMESYRLERDQAIVQIVQEQTSASQLKSHYDQRVESARTIENLLKEDRESIDAAQKEWNGHRLALQEESLRKEHLSTGLRDKYGLSVEEWIRSNTLPAFTEEEISLRSNELEELRSKMNQIGDVNLAAIDELKELQERHVFLTTQKEDLESTLHSLSSAIAKINSTTRELFATTFEAVNSKFQVVFPQLFRGGKAKLVVLDPDNLLETGIDIVAQPPGKRLQNMDLLSGGEKALTAIALIFAIFQHKAPPFCLLDEVDAPLDDANNRRFCSLVKTMSEKTQMIVITHNKATMEIAENLYGITMEEPGISRTVSVKIHARAVETSTASNWVATAA